MIHTKLSITETARFLLSKFLGTFFERIDGERGDKPQKETYYKIQSGFGWTNAIFYRYIKILQDLEDGADIYGFSNEENPPYDLNILN